MKGLIKYLSPFAPDQSGAAAVFYDLGGITVICDAGGCTGNICGFDEPRWFRSKSSIFSAGLRDMDAILGRDDRLIEKLRDAVKKLGASFAVIIGTPVPSVIATDLRALRKVAEKRCGVPVLTVECTGTRLYDEGEEAAYLALFERFAKDGMDTEAGRVGVIGATPLNTGTACPAGWLEEALEGKYRELLSYGASGGLQAVEEAGSVEKNLVLSPSGLPAAQYLKERFGTPYEAAWPLAKQPLERQLDGIRKGNILVIHQQVAANEIRKRLERNGNRSITVASFFLMKQEWKRPQDIHLQTEEEFERLVRTGDFDVIIGDDFLRRACRSFAGVWISAPHFAVSGECRDV